MQWSLCWDSLLSFFCSQVVFHDFIVQVSSLHFFSFCNNQYMCVEKNVGQAVKTEFYDADICCHTGRMVWGNWSPPWKLLAWMFLEVSEVYWFLLYSFMKFAFVHCRITVICKLVPFSYWCGTLVELWKLGGAFPTMSAIVLHITMHISLSLKKKYVPNPADFFNFPLWSGSLNTSCTSVQWLWIFSSTSMILFKKKNKHFMQISTTLKAN